MKRNKTVEEYLAGLTQWNAEVNRLREILCSTDLEETVKWGIPAYTHKGKNVCGIADFKNHFAVWFYQGALLADEKKVLINAQEGKTKAMRQWRMTSKSDIKVRILKSYVKEAIALVDSGKSIPANRSKPIVLSPELKTAFSKNKKAAKAFDAFTKGKQREFAEYISDAKRSETKLKRIEKILPMILDGVGLNDKYR